MKVGTDGLLLAAWTRVGQKDVSILDIGAGTGLIGSVLCKENPHSRVMAIDPSSQAIDLCQKNRVLNQLGLRFLMRQVRFQDYAREEDSNSRYDLIVSNPPFFSEDVKSPIVHRQESRHVDALPLDELVYGCQGLLSPGGRLSVVLPLKAGEKLERLGKGMGWQTSRKTIVMPKLGRSPHRVLLEMAKCTQAVVVPEENTVVIRDEAGSYHSDYLALVGRLHDRKPK